MWHDPAEHARDFSARYAEIIELVVCQRMMDLGIPTGRIGFPDPDQGGVWRAFFPQTGRGGVVLGEGIGLDSGVFNPDLLTADYGRRAGRFFARSRLRDRMDAIIAHEFEEQRNGSHVGALKAAPRTALPISPRAREICKAMEKGWRGR
jgi:hypothetical protein